MLCGGSLYLHFIPFTDRNLYPLYSNYVAPQSTVLHVQAKGHELICCWSLLFLVSGLRPKTGVTGYMLLPSCPLQIHLLTPGPFTRSWRDLPVSLLSQYFQLESVVVYDVEF